MSKITRRIFIFAGCHKEAAAFAKEKGLHPGNWIFLHSCDQLRGIRKKPYIRVGTYYNQRNAQDIEIALLTSEMIEATDVRIKDNS